MTKEIGIVKEITERHGLVRIVIAAQKVIPKAQIGSSILVDGICSTLIRKGKGWFAVEYMPETLRRSTVGSWGKGRKMNLEPSVRFGDEMAGHIVYGHVDAVGMVRNISHRGEDVVYVQLPPNAGGLTRFFVDKGSVTVNGVSLTVVKCRGRTFAVALIPHTSKQTNLGFLKKYDTVNIEADIMAKYAAQWITK